jgi:beta-lactam-binding protein with PASTA domain
MTYRALLIGNSVFEEDAGLNPLNAPTKDVARLHRALVDSVTGLFAEENVRLVIERSSHDLLDEIDTFFSTAHRDDLLLFYYSGHGLIDERNQLFLCGRNTRSDKLLRTAVSNVRVNEFVEQSVARCTVIILDCCSSGMFKGGDVSAPLAGPGRYVISSTRGAALANDAATATGTSLFTEHLVTGLLGAADDRDGDGYLDLREVFDYVRARLTATTKQIPHCRFDGDAAVMLAKRPAAPVPADAAAPRASDPTFVLSENTITLRDVGPDEWLSPETIEIYPLTEAEVDCTAESDATWLNTEVCGGRLTIELHPGPGYNRGKIVVRDRRSGATQVVRVHVAVDRRSPVTPPPMTDEPIAPKPRPSMPGPPGTDLPPRILARVPMPHAIEPPHSPAVHATPEPYPERGGRKKRWLVAVAAAVLLTVGMVGLLTLLHDPPQEGTLSVPYLSGLPRAGAEAALREEGLEPSVVVASSNSACTPGTVIAQDPLPGQPAGHGTQVSITVCGVPMTPVPPLGRNRSSARDALQAVGLHAEFEFQDSPKNEGQVLWSQPSSGVKVQKGSTVTVFLSDGGKTCRKVVPNVKGMMVEHADAALSGAKFVPQIEERTSDEPVGTVLEQKAPAGEEAKCGATVTLIVSAGPETASSIPFYPSG